MKGLIWLMIVLCGQRLSAMPSDKEAVQQCSISFSYQQVFYNNIDTVRQVRYTDSNVVSLHFNSLITKATERGTLLKWEVAETANLQYFLIERALDGQHFSPLFEVPVLMNQRSYSIIDERSEALDKSIFYRVKAVYPTLVVESPVRKRA